MKKTVLTLITICVFGITNAQEKANHNTTRSKMSSDIMVKETGDSVDEDCDGITNSKLFVKITKRGTPDLHLHCCALVKRGWEDATAIAVKEASKKAHTQKHIFVKNNVKYYYNGDLDKLNKCNAKLKEAGWIAENRSIPNATKRKRNKNFNRKGERVKRTQF